MPIPGGSPLLDEGTTVDLVDLDAVKTHLNIDLADDTDDDELSDVIGRASALLLNHPDYTIRDAVVAESHTQDWTGSGDTIVLDHAPVTGITTVTEFSGGTGTEIAAEPIDTETFTGYGYRLNADAGLLTRLSGGYPTNWLGTVRIVYTTGAGDVQPDIRGAVLDLIGHLWETQRGGGAIRPVVGQDFDTLDTATPSYLLPYRVLEALTPYRRGPTVG